MGMILTYHITHGTGRFFVFGIGFEAQLTHRKDNTSLYGLEPIAYMGQCAVENYVHGIIQVGLLGIVA